MDKEKVKQEIKHLIEKYNKVVESGKLKSYNEEMTKKDFILPLFRALGWNIEDSNEVTAEEKISRKRVDYGFRINGIQKFFLEAKSLRDDLDNLKFVEQAINYSWHKGCTWAILTNFKEIKIYNAEWKTANPLQAQFGQTLTPLKFLENFDQLWLISRESFEQGLIDKKAEEWGKKIKKIPVDKQLLADFTRFRELLSKNVMKLNLSRNLTEEDLDESIQRILDRLIFIRNCEDRGLEEKKLWEAKNETSILKELRKVFSYFDTHYNSKLFTYDADSRKVHLCDTLYIDNEVLKEVIEGLYHTKDRSVSYDFSAIEADVLGNIYEQYLGHILKKTGKRAKLKESHTHRKEQGIYYTPTYIVDYIVTNTLGELLKDKKVDAEKIRILDPACGSGSFLIKAFDVLNEYYSKNDENYSQTQIDFKTESPFTSKVKILKNNIFGVDLDKQAVEIAQLNLLLKIAEKGYRLPLLQENIKCGNSLIDDPAIAGDKAFKWEEEFKEMMKDGGFDVVIGNPPYVNIFNIKEQERTFFQEHYATATNKSDLYAFFIEKVINSLLKEEGRLGFIISNTWTSIQSFENLRKLLLEKTIVERIVPLDLGVFADATVVPIILIVRKTRDKDRINKNKIKIFKLDKDQYILDKEIPQALFLNSQGHIFSFSLNMVGQQIFEKLKKETTQLGDLAEFSLGIKTADNDRFVSPDKKDNFSKKVLKGRYIKRYNLEYHNEWIWYKPEEMMKRKGAGPRKRECFEVPKKIILQEISGDQIIATLDTEQYYSLDTVNMLYSLKSGYEFEYILALLNSKLINFWYGAQFKGLHVKLNELRQTPIKPVDKNRQEKIKGIVIKILNLNKTLNEFGDKNTSETAKIKEDIVRAEKEVDKLVYKIYGITEEEKKIIEESLK